jgi:hypothetical protein
MPIFPPQLRIAGTTRARLIELSDLSSPLSRALTRPIVAHENEFVMNGCFAFGTTLLWPKIRLLRWLRSGMGPVAQLVFKTGQGVVALR